MSEPPVRTLSIADARYTVTLQDERVVLYGSGANNLQYRYERAYTLGEEPSATCAHSIHCVDHSSEGLEHSCIVFGIGGATGVHDRSALLHNDQYILAVSAFLIALKLPSLEMTWYTQADQATVFGVYRVPEYQCYITHGELDVTCVSYTGQIIWTTSGKDVFTNGFAIYDDYLEVIDWNNEKYRIDLRTGRNELVRNDS